MIESKSALYDRVEQLCAERGKKVGTMCADIGLSTGMMSDIKSGRSKSMSMKTALLISNYLGVSLDTLFATELNQEAKRS